MIKPKSEDFRIEIDECEGAVSIYMRDIHIGLMSLPFSTEDETSRSKNIEFSKNVVNLYLEAIEQIDGWE